MSLPGLGGYGAGEKDVIPAHGLRYEKCGVYAFKIVRFKTIRLKAILFKTIRLKTIMLKTIRLKTILFKAIVI